MGRLNPESRTPIVPQEQKASTIGPMAVDPSQVGSFVDFLRQATMAVDQVAANPMAAGLDAALPKASDASDRDRDEHRQETLLSPSKDAQRNVAERTQAEAETRTNTTRENRTRSDDTTEQNDSTDNASEGASQTREKAKAADRPDDQSRGDSKNDAASESADAAEHSEAGQDVAAIEAGMQTSLAELAAGDQQTPAGDADEASGAEASKKSQAAAQASLEMPLEMADATELGATSNEGGDGDATASSQQDESAGSTKTTATDDADTLKTQTAQQAIDAADDMAGETQGRHADAKHGGEAQKQAAIRMPQTPEAAAVQDALASAGQTDTIDISAEQAAAAAAQSSAATASVNTGQTSATGNATATNDSIVSTQGANARSVNASQAAKASAGADQTPQIDRARFVQRVARAFNSIANQGGSVRLKLHPEELGALTIRVSVQNGNLTANVEAETKAAQQTLMENLGVLRERLAEQNIKIDRFEVELAGQMDSGLADHSQQNNDSDDGGNPSMSQRGGGSAKEESNDPTILRMPPRLDGEEDGRLDLVG